MEMPSLADIHPFVGAGILLMLWFLMGVAHSSLASERYFLESFKNGANPNF